MFLALRNELTVTRMVDADRRDWPGFTDIPAKRWVLVTGSRRKFSLILAGVLAAITAVVVFGDVVYVGRDSNFATVLASGMLGALATIVTVTLSINQLILSRVFGSPAELTDRLEGNLQFRRSIEAVAGVNTSPNDPGAFLSLVAQTLKKRAASLDRAVQQADDLEDSVREDVESVTQHLVDYARHLESAKEIDSTVEVLSLTFGTDYADYIDDIRRIDTMTEGQVSDAVADDLDSILTLLKGVATIRQFFKTLAVQQDLARLSRQLIYTGVPAILVAYFLAPVYTGPSIQPAISSSLLPWIVILATVVLFSPLLVLVAYLLRVATVTLYTVSVGSFVPPEERVDNT